MPKLKNEFVGELGNKTSDPSRVSKDRLWPEEKEGGEPEIIRLKTKKERWKRKFDEV